VSLGIGQSSAYDRYSSVSGGVQSRGIEEQTNNQNSVQETSHGGTSDETRSTPASQTSALTKKLHSTPSGYGQQPADTDGGNQANNNYIAYGNPVGSAVVVEDLEVQNDPIAFESELAHERELEANLKQASESGGEGDEFIDALFEGREEDGPEAFFPASSRSSSAQANERSNNAEEAADDYPFGEPEPETPSNTQNNTQNNSQNKKSNDYDVNVPLHTLSGNHSHIGPDKHSGTGLDLGFRYGRKETHIATRGNIKETGIQYGASGEVGPSHVSGGAHFTVGTAFSGKTSAKIGATEIKANGHIASGAYITGQGTVGLKDDTLIAEGRASVGLSVDGSAGASYSVHNGLYGHSVSGGFSAGLTADASGSFKAGKNGVAGSFSAGVQAGYSASGSLSRTLAGVTTTAKASVSVGGVGFQAGLANSYEDGVLKLGLNLGLELGLGIKLNFEIAIDFKAVADSFKLVGGAIADFAKDSWNSVKNIATDTFKGIANFSREAFSEVVDFAKDAWNDVKDFAKDTWNGVKNFFSKW